MDTPAERKAVAVALILVLAGTALGVGLAFRSKPVTYSDSLLAKSETQSGLPSPLVVLAKEPPKLFPGLPEPELVLVLSGQMYGYLQPCGCARPQTGGLERRFELLKQLRARGWAVSPADLGDIAPKHVNEQGRIKYETAMQTLQEMGYPAIGLGLTEAGLPLEQALSLAQNFQPPHVLAANLNDKETRFPEMFRGWTVHEATGNRQQATEQATGNRQQATVKKVAYVGLVAESLAKKAKEVDGTLVFDAIDDVLPDVLKEVQAKGPDCLVLLFQGSKDEARTVIAKYPHFQVVVCRDDSDEPASKAERVGETLLVAIGHKGKYVGLVGVFPKRDGGTDMTVAQNLTPQPPSLRGKGEPTSDLSPPFPRREGGPGGLGFDLHYQLVAVSEYFELPDTESNPARERMKDYVERVHRGGFLTKAPKSSHPLQIDFPDARFVGSTACKECHPKAFAVWSESRHSHAYENLAKYGRPLGRQHDPECAECHTTGFHYKTGFVNEMLTPHLAGNGCENCHGPASLRVAEPKNAKYSIPLRLSIGNVERDCRRCHDADNDPHFDLLKYWPKIRHGRE